MLRNLPDDSTALITRSINTSDISISDTSMSDVSSDDIVADREEYNDSSCCTCCDECSCYTVTYTCIPWIALRDAVLDNIDDNSAGQAASKLDCATGVIITPVIAPFALIASTFGFFYGASRDLIDCASRSCSDTNELPPSPSPPITRTL